MRAPLIALALLLTPTAAASAQSSPDGSRSLFTVTKPGPIAAYGTGTLAWSSYDAVTGKFRLETSLRGTTKTAEVPQRAVPFDVDLGPGPNGTPVVVYSRCTTEPPLGPSIPDYTRGRGCDVHLYDLETGKEQLLAGVSRAGVDEVLPTIWGTRVAYVRSRTAYVRDTGFGGADQRRSGPAAGGTPTGQDLRGTLLATAYRTTRGHEIRITGADGQGRLVARTRNSTAVRRPLVSPSFDSGILFYRSTCPTGNAGCTERYWAYRPTSASHSSARVNEDVAWTVHTSKQTFSLVGANGRSGVTCDGLCDFIAERPLVFKLSNPLR